MAHGSPARPSGRCSQASRRTADSRGYTSSRGHTGTRLRGKHRQGDKQTAGHKDRQTDSVDNLTILVVLLRDEKAREERKKERKNANQVCNYLGSPPHLIRLRSRPLRRTDGCAGHSRCRLYTVWRCACGTSSPLAEHQKGALLLLPEQQEVELLPEHQKGAPLLLLPEHLEGAPLPLLLPEHQEGALLLLPEHLEGAPLPLLLPEHQEGATMLLLLLLPEHEEGALQHGSLSHRRRPGSRVGRHRPDSWGRSALRPCKGSQLKKDADKNYGILQRCFSNFFEHWNIFFH